MNHSTTRPLSSFWSPVAAALVVAVGLAACRGGPRPIDDPAVPIGGVFYTQFALQHERQMFRTTNYRRGELLPINTEVTLVDINTAQAVVETRDGWQLVIENMPKHTGGSMVQEFGLIFGPEPVDLRQFNEAELRAIEAGEVEPGMSEGAVLAAIGYPPSSGTASLSSSQWKYWSSRWTTFVVHFDENRIVSRIEQ